MKSLPLLLSIFLIISGCASTVVSKRKFETNYICDNKDKTQNYYFVNRFNRKPTEKEEYREMIAAQQELNEELLLGLINCRAILFKDLPADLFLPLDEV